MSMKNRPLRERIGFAVAAAIVTLALRPDWIWCALVTLTIAIVLLLEMVNAALEYLMDRVHPEYSEEIKFAKDAAAGAVLLASLAALIVGGLMMLSVLLP